jgi:hypothetical protein
MKIDGRCHCGRITFEAEVDPSTVTICHCTDCQTLTGSAFRANIPTSAASFVLRSGTPKSYVKTSAATPSAATAARRFMLRAYRVTRSAALTSRSGPSPLGQGG